MTRIPPGQLLREATTWVELLQVRAHQHPERKACTYMVDGEREDGSLTYGDLDRAARAVAASLQQRRLSGQRLLLIHPPGLEFVIHFFGCLYAGAIPVPVAPPRAHRPPAGVQAVGVDAAVAAVVSTPAVLDRSPHLTALIRSMSWNLITSNDLTGVESSVWQPPPVRPHDVAFLQYTSGSTLQPRGVRVTHANLLANAVMIADAFDLSEAGQYVSWLPHFHDMGLIGMILQSLAIGGHCLLLSPMVFVQRPWRWLEAISRYRATVSGAPNFAYDLCVRRIPAEARAKLDLSCWRVAFCGAEVVRAATLDRFAAAFRPYAFRREAFYPTYGLAEATLLATGGAVEEPPVIADFVASALERNQAVPASALDRTEAAERATLLVGCGQARQPLRLVVVDPETRLLCQSGQVGEIWLTGPSVADGYWNRPEETERVFCAELSPSDGSRYLRTGDLGFLHEGQLFITGRIKDLIILHGRNVHPQDVEESAERSHAFLCPGGCAAFSVDDGEEEGLVVLGEVIREQIRSLPAAEVTSRIRQTIWEEYELPVQTVVLLRPASLRRTSSGKLQRYACRTAFRVGTLEGMLHTSHLPGR